MTYPEDDRPVAPDDVRYEKPTLTRLGTLAELTLGGVVGLDDGMGGAGDVGGSV